MYKKEFEYEIYKLLKSSKTFHELMLYIYSTLEKANEIDIYSKRDLEKLLNTFKDFKYDVKYYEEKF